MANIFKAKSLISRTGVFSNEVIAPNLVYNTGEQFVSGFKKFHIRPTVNGTGVLLSGEAASLPVTIVYTTGNQTISGTKTFANNLEVQGTGIFNALDLSNISEFNFSGTNINLISGNVNISGQIYISGNPVLTGVNLSSYATTANLASTGSTLATNLASTGSTLVGSITLLSGLFTGFTGNLDATFASDTQLASTGSSLQTNINNLSGVAVLTFGNQTIQGVKTFTSGATISGPISGMYGTGDFLNALDVRGFASVGAELSSLTGIFGTGNVNLSGFSPGQFSAGNLLIGQNDGGAYIGRTNIRENSWQIVTDTIGSNWITGDIIKPWFNLSLSSDGRIQTAAAYYAYGDHTGQLYVSNDYGLNWTSKVSPTGEGWVNVVMSSDGKIQSATRTTDTDKSYISYDYGNTWIKNDSLNSLDPSSIAAMSSDGRIQLSIGMNVYISYDYGRKWNIHPSAEFGFATAPYRAAMSSDGKIQIMVGGDGCLGACDSDSVYISYNYGLNWKRINNAGYGIFTDVAMSADGRIIITTHINGPVLISYNYGVSWNSISFDFSSIRGLSISSDGKIIAVGGTLSGTYGAVFLSKDYGQTWYQHFEGPEAIFSVKMSSDGRIITAVGMNGKIYISYATTVSPNPISVLGDIQASGQIYISGNPVLTGIDLSSYATTSNLASTGLNLSNNINSLSGLFTGYTGSLDATFASDIQLFNTGVTLNNSINSLSGSSVLLYGNQTISGLKDFSTRPTVNTTPVLLSGENANGLTVLVKNDEPATLLKGQPVYIYGANGNNILVRKASNTGEAYSSKTLGLLAQDLISNGQGLVITEGALEGINTDAGNAGDPIWLGPTGDLIFGLAQKPYAPNHLVYLGVIERKQINNGKIYVKVQNGFELQELHNVNIDHKNALNDSDIIRYNSASGLWFNETLNTGVFQTQINSLSGYVNSTSSNIVFTTGNQNISGTKNFIDNVNFSGTGTFNAIDLNNIDNLSLSGVDVTLTDSIINVNRNIFISGNPVLTGVNLTPYATTVNLALTGLNLSNNISSLSGLFTGFTGNLDATFASDIQLANTGSTLVNSINSLSDLFTGFTGSLDASFATDTQLANTGSTIVNSISSLSGTLTSTYATINNLASTGSTLQSNINSLSGYVNSTSSNIVFTTGNQNIGGNKTFTGVTTFSGQQVNIIDTALNLSGLGDMTFEGTNINFINSPVFISGTNLRVSGTVLANNLNNLAYTTGNQNISGIKTFNVAPIVSGNPLITGDLSLYATITNLASTGSTLNNNIVSLSGLFTGFTGNLDATFASDTQLANTGSTLVDSISSLSGTLTSTYATILNLASTGSTLATNLANTGSTLQTNINNLSNTYATITNVGLTGSTLVNNITSLSGLFTGYTGSLDNTYATDLQVLNTGITLNTTINNLSGYINSTSSNIVFTTGNQTISGVKTFVQDATFGDTGQGDFLVISGNNFTVYGSGNFTSGLFVSGNPVLTGSSTLYATTVNLASTGSTLDTKINNLSGVSVLTFGNQTISGIKSFATGINIINSGNPQNLRVFNTTGTNSGEFGLFGWQDNQLIIGSQATNSGILRNTILTGVTNIFGPPNQDINISAFTSGIPGIFGSAQPNNINLTAGTGMAGFTSASIYGTISAIGNIDINNNSIPLVAKSINIYRTGINNFGLPGSYSAITIDNDNISINNPPISSPSNNFGLRISGVAVTPANYVTLTNNQTISGVKTFIGNHNISGDLNVTGNSNIRGALDVTGLVVSGLGTSFILKSPANYNSVYFDPTSNGNAGSLFSDYVYVYSLGSRGDQNLTITYGGGGSRSTIFRGGGASVDRVLLDSNGNFGIGSGISSVPSRFYVSGNSVLQGDLTVSGNTTITGHLSAASKSFLIDHPTQAGKKLQYGSLESPYHGIRLTDRNKISAEAVKVYLPEYISSLVNEDKVNIQVTNINHDKVLFVKEVDINENNFTVGMNRGWFDKNEYEFYWSFTAERKDIPKLTVEF